MSLESGPRLVTQVGAQLYRDMQAHSGLLADLARRFPSSGDALADALLEYDSLSSPDKRSRQALTLFLAFYASSTKTWTLIKPLSQIDGAHLFVFDWQAKYAKTTVLRPAHHHQAGPMHEEEIAALFGYVLQSHLRLHPSDAPIQSHLNLDWN